MGFFAIDAILENGPEYLRSNCDLLVLCPEHPADYATAQSSKRAEQAVDSSDFAWGDSGTGRALTLAAQEIAAADSTGYVTHLACLDVGSTALLYVSPVQEVTNGTAQAGASTTITLASGASANDDEYNGMAVIVGAQTRYITDYDGTTKVATVGSAWDSNPDSSSAYTIYGRHVTTGEAVDLGAMTITVPQPEKAA